MRAFEFGMSTIPGLSDALDLGEAIFGFDWTTGDRLDSAGRLDALRAASIPGPIGRRNVQIGNDLLNGIRKNAPDVPSRSVQDAIDRARKKTLPPEAPDAYISRAKPPYETNPAHVPGTHLNPRKTVEPPDASVVYENAVRTGIGEWHGIGADGMVYRYFSDNAGKVHFSASMLPIHAPGHVRKALGL